MDVGSTERTIDDAAVILALKQIIDASNEVKHRAEAVGWMSRQLNVIETIQAQTMRENLGRVFDIYQDSWDARFQSGTFLRFLRLGSSGNQDANRAADGARQEIGQLVQVVERMSLEQKIAAVRLRMPLLEFIAGSHEGGVGLAMQMLRSMLPQNEYERVVRVARETGGRDQHGRGDQR